MTDGRKRSAAKQARRDARRRKARDGRAAEMDTLDEAPLIDEVRMALDGGQPMDLLGLVSMLILATAPRPALWQPPDAEDRPSLGELVSAFIELRVPETTALLTVLGQLIPNDDALRNRCRDEVDARNDGLPHWLAELAQTTVREAVRMTHVLGDGEELLLGVRLADGQEMTCAVSIDHLEMSEVRDAFFVPAAIDAVIDIGTANNTDPDTSFLGLGLTEARARLQNALARPLAPFPLEESDTWPGCRALVQWLARLLPADSSISHVLQRDWAETAPLLQRFLASPEGAPYDDPDHRELLELCIDEGTGDPLRWSAARVRQLLDAAVVDDDAIEVDIQLDVPELLRVYIPFAHAESGIRHELTAEALAVIDELADDYRAMVLEGATSTTFGDDERTSP
ncbi:MAG: hypothetical protein ABW001_11070 [Mycobacterium sp.]